MNRFIVSKINVSDYDENRLNEIFSELDGTKIECCNWPDKFPYIPLVQFKAFHNGEKLFLQFNVVEKDIHSVISEDFGDVWTDPCVEFFVSPDENSYYNFECTCIGRMLVACHVSGGETIKMPTEILATVERYSTLGNSNFGLCNGETVWSIIEVIPAKALFNHEIFSWDGKRMRANFYKCGDNLPNPHFLSWNRIEYPRPNFHLPEFFGEVYFSATE